VAPNLKEEIFYVSQKSPFHPIFIPLNLTQHIFTSAVFHSTFCYSYRSHSAHLPFRLKLAEAILAEGVASALRHIAGVLGGDGELQGHP